jgi:hypothetical protein
MPFNWNRPCHAGSPAFFRPLHSHPPLVALLPDCLIPVLFSLLSILFLLIRSAENSKKVTLIPLVYLAPAPARLPQHFGGLGYFAWRPISTAGVLCPSVMSPFPAFYRILIVPLLFRETIIPLEPSQTFPVRGE